MIGNDKKKQIISLLKEGLTHKEVAERTGVSVASVDRIAKELDILCRFEHRLSQLEEDFYGHLADDHGYEGEEEASHAA